MTKQYKQQVGRWWLLIWLTGTAGLVKAQPAPPPLQWQRVIPGGDVTTATVRAAATSNGGYAVLAGKNLVRLSAAGNLLSTNPVMGTYQDSTATYTVVRQTLGLTATPDGGTVVLTQDVKNIYYAAKFDAGGNRVWTRPVAGADVGPGRRLTADALVAAPDRSLLVAGTFSDDLTYLTLTKLSADGYITGEWRIKSPDATPSLTPVVRRILPAADGGYLLVGRAANGRAAGGAVTSQGLAIKLDKNYGLTWQRTYPGLDSLLDVVPNPVGGDTYTAIGLSGGTTVSAITIAPGGATDGTLVATLPGSFGLASLAADGTGNLTVLDGTGAGTSDFRLTNVAPQSAVRWTKTVGGSGNDVPAGLLATEGGGYLLVGTTTSGNGDVVGNMAGTVVTWVVKLGTAPVGPALSLTTPLYNCQTGVIVFNTTGGDGTPVTYDAPGIERAQPTDNFGTVEPGIRNDPKVLTIQATQSGKTVSYTFDFSSYCRNLPPVTPPTPNALMLTPPTYNCRTGAITFHTTGGDSTTIEYAAPGITTWTANPNQVVESGVRTDYAIQPLTLMARQGGRVVMYVFDLKAECGRARIGVDEPATGLPPTGLAVSVIGNPVRDAVRVLVTGAAGQSLLMQLVDERGRMLEHRIVEQAGEAEQQLFDVKPHTPGVLLLRTTADKQVQTVKIIKQ